MKKIVLLLVIALSFAGFAQSEEGIKFDHGTWKEILARAKEENKLVMLDAYTSWCGPCKWMAKNIFPMKDVADFYNKNFVPAKIDMEKGEGIEIAKKYEVMNYPTFLFVDGEGKLVHRICGSREADAFMKAGKEAMSPTLNYAFLEKNFKESGKPAAATAYFNAASEACMDVEKDVSKYLAAKKPEELFEQANYDLLMYFINEHTNPSFTYLVSHYTDFTAKHKKEDIDEKIKTVYTTSIKKALRSKEAGKLVEVQKAYREQANAPVKYLDSYTNMTQAKISRDTSLYFKAIIEFTDNYLLADVNALNSNAWDFYEKTDNKAYLVKAEEWAKKSTELAPGYANFDTYAAVLFKLGKYPEAKATATKAIDLGKKNSEDVKETEGLLDKINEKLKV